PKRQLVRQIEGLAELVSRQCLDMLILFRKIAPIMYSPKDVDIIPEYLIRLTLAVHPIGGAQNSVARNNIADSGMKPCLVHCARQSVCNTDVQRGVGAIHSLQEPHPQLACRKTLTFTRADAWMFDRCRCGHAAFGDTPTQ